MKFTVRMCLARLIVASTFLIIQIKVTKFRLQTTAPLNERKSLPPHRKESNYIQRTPESSYLYH